MKTEKPDSYWLSPNFGEPIYTSYMIINLIGYFVLIYLLPSDILKNDWALEFVNLIGGIVPQIKQVLCYYKSGNALGEIVFTCAVCWVVNITITPIVSFLGRKEMVYELFDNPDIKYLHRRHRFFRYMLLPTLILIIYFISGEYDGGKYSIAFSKIYHNGFYVAFCCFCLTVATHESLLLLIQDVWHKCKPEEIAREK